MGGGCAAHSADEQACLGSYIVKGNMAIACAWQSCGCFADGETLQECSGLDALCTAMVQLKALRGRRSDAHRLDAAVGMMFVQASADVVRMDDEELRGEHESEL